MKPEETVKTLVEEIKEGLDLSTGDIKNIAIDTKKKTITITLDYHEVPEDDYVGLKSY